MYLVVYTYIVVYSCTLGVYFAPEPTIVCKCINIGTARPNKILTVMNLLASFSGGRFSCTRACDFLCVR